VALVAHPQAVGPLVPQRVRDVVLDAHHLGLEVSVDVKDVVVVGAVEEGIDLVELLGVGRHHLAKLGDVTPVHVRTAARHGTSGEQKKVLVGLPVPAAAVDLLPRGGQKLRPVGRHRPPERVEGVVQRVAHVHVRDPREIAVGDLGGNVVDRVGALVRGEGSAPGCGIERDLLAVVVGVVVEGPDRVDGGELHEAEAAVLLRIQALRHRLEEAQEVRAQRLDLRGAEAGGPGRGLHELSKAALLLRAHPGDPEAAGKHAVHQVELAVARHRLLVAGRHVGDPAAQHLVAGYLDAKDAIGVQALHQLEVALAQLGGREIFLVFDELFELDLLDRLLEVLEGGVLGEHDPPLPDQHLVGLVAEKDIACVAGDGLVRENHRDAQLVAAPDLEVDAVRLLAAGSEARVERAAPRGACRASASPAAPVSA